MGRGHTLRTLFVWPRWQLGKRGYHLRRSRRGEGWGQSRAARPLDHDVPVHGGLVANDVYGCGCRRIEAQRRLPTLMQAKAEVLPQLQVLDYHIWKGFVTLHGKLVGVDLRHCSLDVRQRRACIGS